METIHIAKNDIQALLIRAYDHLSEARYLMLQFSDKERTKMWLNALIPEIATGNDKEKKFVVQLAFTNNGVFRLVPKEHLTEPFSPEFTEGMVSDHRERILGDRDTNAYQFWKWGGRENEMIDAVLMLFAPDKETLEKEQARLEEMLAPAGIKKVIQLDTKKVGGRKEHFGFDDGLSNPLIIGLGENETDLKEVRKDSGKLMPGEFIMGYPNEYNQLPFSPKITHNNALFDLGRNGSYMVIRQLEQDVKKFWNYMHEEVATNPYFKGDSAVYLASKIVGRWPNGNPLTLDPVTEGEKRKEQNDFLFKKDDIDTEGFKCPVGSHIRKSNPRDGIDENPAVSVDVSKRHRILRRGRSYGEPLHEDLVPEKMLQSGINDTGRGLYFICFNTNISRQFEFIQHTWDNNKKFDGLYKDVDPLNGFPSTSKEFVPGEFTIQACPVRKKAFGIPQFVFVKGGAYFFMPGIDALRFFATHA